jgi:hypothetical protein
MGLSGQLHAPATLPPPGEGPQYVLVYFLFQVIKMFLIQLMRLKLLIYSQNRFHAYFFLVSLNTPKFEGYCLLGYNAV